MVDDRPHPFHARQAAHGRWLKSGRDQHGNDEKDTSADANRQGPRKSRLRADHGSHASYECHRRESNSQLPDLESDASTSWATVARVPSAGFEPALDGLSDHCRYQLGYRDSSTATPAAPASVAIEVERMTDETTS